MFVCVCLCESACKCVGRSAHWHCEQWNKSTDGSIASDRCGSAASPGTEAATKMNRARVKMTKDTFDGTELQTVLTCN